MCGVFFHDSHLVPHFFILFSPYFISSGLPGCSDLFLFLLAQKSVSVVGCLVYRYLCGELLLGLLGGGGLILRGFFDYSIKNFVHVLSAFFFLFP